MAGPAAHNAGTYAPANGNIDNGGQISLGVRFTVAEVLSLGGVTFYAPTTNTGTYSFALYETTSDDDPNGTGTGTLIDSGSIAAASITPGTWNDLTLPFEAQPGVVYTARVHTSSGRFVNTPNAFASAGLTGNGVTLLQTGASPSPPTLGSMLNGVFLDGAIGYPNTRFDDADYGIDVWLADAVEPIDVAGAIAVGEPAVSGTASVQVRAVGAISVGEPTLAGEVLVITPISVSGSVVVDEPVVSGTGTTPIVEQPSGFDPLLDMFRAARRNAGVRVRPVDCPRCGEPLESARGVLHCPFDGSIW